MTILNCQISCVDSITDSVYRIRLKPKENFFFRAGQYLITIIDQHNIRSFSLASSPMEKSFIELHICLSQSKTIKNMINSIKITKKMTIDFPKGTAWLRDNTNRPIILIANGIGFAYTRSILLTVLKKQPKRKIEIYWGGKERKHLYYLNELERLNLQYSQLSVIPILEKPDSTWIGRSGTVLSAVIQDHKSLQDNDIYIAGRFDMAKIARERLCMERNANIQHIFSDAFTYI